MHFYELVMEVEEQQSSTIRREYKFTSFKVLNDWLRSVASDSMFIAVKEVRKWYPIDGHYFYDPIETLTQKAQQIFTKQKTIL